MRGYLYKKINAFASDSSTGNPAACLYLEKGQTLSEEAMQAIAREHKGFVSEVVYCAPLPDSRYRLRYFLPSARWSFAGMARSPACMM